MTHKLQDGQTHHRLIFPVPPFIPGECDVDLIKRDNRALAICAEMYNNPGRSIDNATEAVIQALLTTFDLSDVTVVLKFGWFSYSGQPDARSSREKNRFTLVRFTAMQGAINVDTIQKISIDEQQVMALRDEIVGK